MRHQLTGLCFILLGSTLLACEPAGMDPVTPSASTQEVITAELAEGSVDWAQQHTDPQNAINETHVPRQYPGLPQAAEKGPELRPATHSASWGSSYEPPVTAPLSCGELHKTAERSAYLSCLDQGLESADDCRQLGTATAELCALSGCAAPAPIAIDDVSTDCYETCDANASDARAQCEADGAADESCALVDVYTHIACISTICIEDPTLQDITCEERCEGTSLVQYIDCLDQGGAAGDCRDRSLRATEECLTLCPF
jgi:hypothetical protein